MKPGFRHEETLLSFRRHPGFIRKRCVLLSEENIATWLSVIYTNNSISLRYLHVDETKWGNKPFSVLNTLLLIYRRFSIFINMKIGMKRVCLNKCNRHKKIFDIRDCMAYCLLHWSQRLMAATWRDVPLAASLQWRVFICRINRYTAYKSTINYYRTTIYIRYICLV